MSILIDWSSSMPAIVVECVMFIFLGAFIVMFMLIASKWLYNGAHYKNWENLVQIVVNNFNMQIKLMEMQNKMESEISKLHEMLASTAKAEHVQINDDKDADIVKSCCAPSTIASITETNGDESSTTMTKKNMINEEKGKDNTESSVMSKNVALYETQSLCNQYMEFHYTPSVETFAFHASVKHIESAYDFHARLVQKFAHHMPHLQTKVPSSSSSSSSSPQITTAIDVGCATGGSTFALSTLFDKVIGFDLSCNFIKLAAAVQKEWSKTNSCEDDSNASKEADKPELERGKNALHLPYHYNAPVQGEIKEIRSRYPVKGQHPERCEFHVADCLNLFSDQQEQPTLTSDNNKNKKEEEMNDVEIEKSNGHEEVNGTVKAKQEINTTHQENGNKEDENELCKLWQMQRSSSSAMFDGVLCVNLLDRVPNPQHLLDTCVELTRPNDGVFVLCDPYSWSENVTPKDKWIGGRYCSTTHHTSNKDEENNNKDSETSENGYVKADKNDVNRNVYIRSEEAVKEYLRSTCDLLEESDEPFLIRDHIRHYQLGIAHCTVWRRRS